MASGWNLEEGGEERLGEEGAEAEKGEAPWGGRGRALSVMMSMWVKWVVSKEGD